MVTWAESCERDPSEPPPLLDYARGSQVGLQGSWPFTPVVKRNTCKCFPVYFLGDAEGEITARHFVSLGNGWSLMC